RAPRRVLDFRQAIDDLAHDRVEAAARILQVLQTDMQASSGAFAISALRLSSSPIVSAGKLKPVAAAPRRKVSPSSPRRRRQPERLSGSCRFAPETALCPVPLRFLQTHR